MVSANSKLSKLILLVLTFSGAFSGPAPALAKTSAKTGAPLSCASSLWGENGENWKPEGRLSDYSYVGYHAGEAQIPNAPVVADLKKDFGAVGDGVADDTQAFLNAIAKSPKGAIFIPAGTYVISQKLQITRGDLVLRGEGPAKTILYFPKSLTDLFGNTPNAAHQSQWSFGPGLITFAGTDPIDSTTLISGVTAPAVRGDTKLTVSDASKISVGQWVRLIESDPVVGSPKSGSLLSSMIGNILPVGPELSGAQNVVRFQSRVLAIKGNTLTLERPLPYEVRAEWKPELHLYRPSIQEVGVEHLSVRFPHTPFPGHFNEKGYNGIFMNNVGQCWVRDVQILNADFGLGLYGTSFCTVSGITLGVTANRADDPNGRAPLNMPGLNGWNGHHGIDLSHGIDNLVTDFHIRTRFIHDISVEWYSLNTVYSNGEGIDLNMDHHREFNFSSLFENLNLGEGGRAFESSGTSTRGPHAGAYTTYWNLTARHPFALPVNDFGPPLDFGPLLNFINLPLLSIPDSLPNKWLVESFGGPESGAPEGAKVNACPRDIMAAMQSRRLARRLIQRHR